VKSYILLLVVSLPLIHAGFEYVEALRVDLAASSRQREAINSSKDALISVHKRVKWLTEADGKLRLAALGVGAYPDPNRNPKGSEQDLSQDLSRGFEPYCKALETVALFTTAFAAHKDLTREQLVGARKSAEVLQNWLEQRHKPEFLEQEKSLDEMIKNNEFGEDGRLRLLEYARSDVCNTDLLIPPLSSRDPISTEFARKGSLLILVIKTTELLEGDNPEHIDGLFEALGEKKSKLVGGQFVLVTSAEAPNPGAVVWDSRLRNARDAFAPSTDPRLVFNKALDVARKVKALRAPTGSPLRAVEILWINGGKAPDPSENRLPLDVGTLKVHLNWVGPVSPNDDRENLGALLAWFSDNVNPIDETHPWWDVLKNQLIREASP
jgi:hypothetical protein